MVSVLPAALHAALCESLGAEPLRAVALSGGMINRAARVETKDGPVFVKWNDGAPPGFFAAEAQGLETLRAVNKLRVPSVLAMLDTAVRSASSAPPYLALEFIQERPPSDPDFFAQLFGAQLAALHLEAVSPFAAYGLEYDNYLGSHVQINTPHQCWSDFYRDCRLLPQIDLARQKGLLPPDRERAVMHVVEHLESLLAGLESRPALLHGDLWGGNFLVATNEPVVIDPAIYYGDREIEIAYIELFGGFPAGLIQAYQAAYPLDGEYARRRPLHQLYPLLVHLNHFGETYGPHVERVCRLIR